MSSILSSFPLYPDGSSCAPVDNSFAEGKARIRGPMVHVYKMYTSCCITAKLTWILTNPSPVGFTAHGLNPMKYRMYSNQTIDFVLANASAISP